MSFVVAVPMTVVSDKGSETGTMIEFQKILRFALLSVDHRACTQSICTHLAGEMRHQIYPKMSSSHGFKSKASIIHQLKGSGRGFGKGKATISVTSS